MSHCLTPPPFSGPRGQLQAYLQSVQVQDLGLPADRAVVGGYTGAVASHSLCSVLVLLFRLPLTVADIRAGVCRVCKQNKQLSSVA